VTRAAGQIAEIRDQVREAIVRVGWSETARRSGYDRCNLHRAFRKNSRTVPNLATIVDVAEAVGLKIEVRER
jgi:DNA-binding phage protein